MAIFNFFKKNKKEKTSAEVLHSEQKTDTSILKYKLRNNLKSETFYTRGIELMNERALKSIVMFEEYKKTKPNAVRTKASYFMEASALLASFLMQYCRGDNLDILKTELKNIFNLYTKSFSKGSIYNETLNILSLGILFDLPKKYFDDFYKEMEKEQVEDYLFSYLVNSKVPEAPICKKLIFKKNKAFIEMVKIIESNLEYESINLINDLFAKNWYTKANFEIYYDTHNGDGIFLGYYAWSVAAIVKIKNIDDSSFKDSPYYPTDLVHWKG